MNKQKINSVLNTDSVAELMQYCSLAHLLFSLNNFYDLLLISVWVHEENYLAKFHEFGVNDLDLIIILISEGHRLIN